jgi:hypothetical protein
LGTAKHQEAEEGGFVAAKVEDSADAVLIFGDAGVVDWGREGEVFERVKRLADLVFREVKDGIAAGALVARVDQSVERERVVLRGGDLFFDQGAENAELDRVKLHIYKVSQMGRSCRADNGGRLCRPTNCCFSTKIK